MMNLNLGAKLLVGSIILVNLVNAQTSDTIPTINSHRKVRKINYYPEQYRNVPVKDNFISVFALGTDLVREHFINKQDMNWGTESNDYLNPTTGFNIYGVYMPKSFRTKRKLNPSIGNFNWGLGISVNQFRNTPREIIEINTVNRDKAQIRLSSDHFSFYSIARYEWGWARIFPFIGVQGGLVYASTQQEVNNYLQLTEYESSSSVHKHGSTTAYIAPELGLRLRLNSWVSAMVSYEWRFGSTIKVDDYKSAVYNSSEGQFQIDRKDITYETQAWKFGFLFDLSGNKYEKEKIRDAYSDTTYVMEEIVKNNPCPVCPECPTESKTSTSSPENKDNKKTNLEINPDPNKPKPAPIIDNSTPTINTIPTPKKPLPGVVVPIKPKIKS